MISKEHYFDWAATAPSDEEILRKALDTSIEHWGNPSSIHEAGTDARKALEEARKRTADALEVPADTIYFTSGGTESDHIPLLSLLSRQSKGSIIVSAIEHPAVREMAKMMKNTGWECIFAAPDKNGFVQPESIIENLKSDTAFVAVMAVNNETGAVQPVAKIAEALESACKGKRKPLFHVDCVQAAGKIPLSFLGQRGIDSAAFSAHKIGGPRGIGALYLSRQITPFLRGGGQEKTVRSGTENLFGATALSLCMEKYSVSRKNPAAEKRLQTQVEYTKSFINLLMEIKGCVMIPHSRTASNESPELYSPWVVQASFPGIPGQVMERALSAEGFYISTGSACSSGHHDRPVLDTMGISGAEKESAVRFSFGWDTTYEAMQSLAEHVKKIALQFAH
ncbi:MAG TPA: cysteine desulfurase [Treponema sp.]|nr:cysteine desulfurase [Treponema sp.]